MGMEMVSSLWWAVCDYLPQWRMGTLDDSAVPLMVRTHRRTKHQRERKMKHIALLYTRNPAREIWGEATESQCPHRLSRTLPHGESTNTKTRREPRHLKWSCCSHFSPYSSLNIWWQWLWLGGKPWEPTYKPTEQLSWKGSWHEYWLWRNKQHGLK